MVTAAVPGRWFKACIKRDPGWVLVLNQKELLLTGENVDIDTPDSQRHAHFDLLDTNT
jgi:hypothetical protein